MDNAPEVSVGLAIQSNVPVTLQLVGHVSPFSSVAIRSQVSGRLEAVHFHEGDMVKTGALLFSIDSRPFADSLAQAKSSLDKDLGLQKQAAIEQGQNAVLFESKIVSKENYNESAAYADSLKATVAADKAAVDSAQLELSYCDIRSPIAGRAGFVQVNPGNLVQIGEMVLVTINQTQPVFVDFPVPEQHLAPLRESASHAPLQVLAISDHDQKCYKGELTAIDNAVDPSTRTILMRARFANPDEALWPGQSVSVRLDLQTLTNAVLIPVEAVQKGPQDEFVFVVQRDAAVECRPIQTRSQLGGRVIVSQGLVSGERVVIRTQQHLVPGMKVRVL